MNVFVTGGAGYIGSHMVRSLTEAGHGVTVFDDLSTGHRDAIGSTPLVQASLADRDTLRLALQEGGFDAVLHFAGSIEVGESVRDPGKYYRNIAMHSLNLIEAMHAADVRNLIFSSTAAIFGEPKYVPIDEAHPRQPVNPYGRAKLQVEEMLADCDRAYGIKSVCLRYFNAAGAHPSGDIGERHEPESHLIPLLLQTVSGRRRSMQLYGRDYDTPDGSCIRDFIHVVDLCAAHLLALDHLDRHRGSASFNLGTGNGFSVLEVIEAVERVTRKRVNVIDAPRRPGDPARLVADSRLIRAELGWKPIYEDLDDMVAHAWAWEQKLAR